MKTFCFKLYRAKRNKKLNRQIDATGLIWNHCLALNKRYYKFFGKYLEKSKLQKHLTKLKRRKKFSYLREINSQAVQDVTDRIDRAYRLFFNNFKRGVKSIIINNQSYLYFKSREIVGKIKTITIKRDNVGNIFIFVVTDYKKQEVFARTGKSVGFDFGFKEKILIASDEKDIHAPSFLRSNMQALKRASKSLSKKKEGSKNRERVLLELVRIYRKADNRRKDFHWKLAQRLCSEYALICVEDLSLKGLQRRHGKKMQDYGFVMFLRILEYVASCMGTTLIKIDRFYPSSQLCSVCGNKNPEIKDLAVREWHCPKCGVHHDRDRNAAINILNEGTRMFLSA